MLSCVKVTAKLLHFYEIYKRLNKVVKKTTKHLHNQKNSSTFALALRHKANTEIR